MGVRDLLKEWSQVNHTVSLPRLGAADGFSPRRVLRALAFPARDLIEGSSASDCSISPGRRRLTDLAGPATGKERDLS
jgi:hypothetical protein